MSVTKIAASTDNQTLSCDPPHAEVTTEDVSTEHRAFNEWWAKHGCHKMLLMFRTRLSPRYAETLHRGTRELMRDAYEAGQDSAQKSRSDTCK